MRYARVSRQWLVRWALMLPGALLVAAASMAQNITPLADGAATVNLQGKGTVWIDTSGRASLQQVITGPDAQRFQPAAQNAKYSLGPQAALWFRYRFVSAAGLADNWLLEFPQPLLDKATVYQRNAQGQWSAQTAGDTVANASWPVPGRYTQFRLDLPGNTDKDVYVRIQHAADISILAQLRTSTSQGERLQMEYLALGVSFGALLLLCLSSLVQSWMYRDAVYGWYALYTVLLTGVVAAWTGVGGHLVWPNSDYWSDLAPGCLGILTAGAGLQVIHKLCGRGAGKPWFEYAIDGFALAAVPLALVYAALPRDTGVQLIGLYMLGIVLLAVHRAWITWRREDPVGLWVLVAFTPMIFAAALVVATIQGVVPMSWASQHLLLASFVLEAPLLLLALKLRSRQRHGVEGRAQVIATQDALTGLLTEPLFNDRLKQVVMRAKRHKEPAAVVYIDLVNYAFIKQTWGVAVAEQSLLRSVIKLRRILRDVDTVGRIDEARFALVLEGATSRQSVTDIAARMVAAGLMPLEGLKPDVLLQFHAVGMLLGERMASAEEVGQLLGDLMASMNKRTRRPIRFVEPELTRPMDLGSESEFEPSGKKYPQKQKLAPTL